MQFRMAMLACWRPAYCSCLRSVRRHIQEFLVSLPFPFRPVAVAGGCNTAHACLGQAATLPVSAYGFDRFHASVCARHSARCMWVRKIFAPGKLLFSCNRVFDRVFQCVMHACSCLQAKVEEVALPVALLYATHPHPSVSLAAHTLFCAIVRHSDAVRASPGLQMHLLLHATAHPLTGANLQ